MIPRRRQVVQQPDRAKTEPLAQLERAGAGRLQCVEILFVLEGQLDGLDFLCGALGKVGDGTMFDLAVRPIGLAQQDTLISLAANGDFGAVDVHSEHNITIIKPTCKLIIIIISGYVLSNKSRHLIGQELLA